jgi:hypothetical protein
MACDYHELLQNITMPMGSGQCLNLDTTLDHRHLTISLERLGFGPMSVSMDLLQEIKDGAKALGIAPSTLCQRAVKNGYVVSRLEGGASVTLKTAEAIRAYIEANRPKEAAE